MIFSSCRKLPLFCLLFLSLIYGWVAPAYAIELSDINFTRLDNYAMNTPKRVTKNVKTLTRYLLKPTKTDLEKTRVLFRWVAHNISYDVDAYNSGSYRNKRTTPETILRDRKGVCDGYAKLFGEMAKTAGLEVKQISGWAKGAGFSKKGELAKEPDHAWNMVKIGGNWHLLDATWAAGNVNGTKFTRAFNAHYFLTPPEQFIYNHFPEEENGQLLEDPLSLEDYKTRPQVWGDYFNSGLKTLSHPNARFKSGAELKITLGHPPGLKIIAALSNFSPGKAPKKLPENHVAKVLKKGKTQFHVRFPKKGVYTLMVFTPIKGGQKKTSNAYTAALNYYIDATGGTTKLFPRFFDGHEKYGVKLLSHVDGVIHTGKSLTIKMRPPEGVKLMSKLLKNNKGLGSHLTFSHMGSDGVVATRTLFPKKGTYTFRVFAAKKGKNNYAAILDYTVKAKKGAGSRAGFPLTYSAFENLGMELIAPFARKLKPGKTIGFSVKSARISQAMVIQGTKRTPLKAKGNLFSGKVKVGKGKLSVFVTPKGKKTLTGILGYNY